MATNVGVAARIVACLLDAAREVQVADVRIGLGYTAVMLEDHRLGLAYTFRDGARGGCSVFNGLRPIAGRPAAELLALLDSPDLIEAGVGLACANALGNRASGELLDGDLLDQLEIGPEEHVDMVGHFGPLERTIRARARSLTIFERVERADGVLRPACEATDALPQCQVALITATSIINHKIDDLLRAASGCREVVVLGASTPLLREVFDEARVTMLSGVVVRDPQHVLQVVSEGGGIRQFSPHVNKVSLRPTQ
jgi:uncharacterized protein (DUF4213/DUF364 family)